MVPSSTNDNRPATAVTREHKRTDRISMSKMTVSSLKIAFWQSGPNMEHPTEKFENRTTLKMKMKNFF